MKDKIAGPAGRWRTQEMAMNFAVAMVIAGTLLGCAEKIHHHVDYVPPTQFLLGPEDVLMVNVWRNEELSSEVVVRPDGKISLPLIGDIRAVGLTADQLSARIADQLTEFMQDPTVSVQVMAINSNYIYVLGEVAAPGKISLKSYTTVLQAISLAGGLTQFASKNNIQVLRREPNGDGKPEIRIRVRYKDLISGDGEIGNFILKSQDTIVVP